MKLAEFQKFAKAKGYQVIGECAYGKCGKFPIIVCLNNIVTGLYIQTIWNISVSDYRHVRTQLKAMLGKGVIVSWENEDTMIVAVPARSEDMLYTRFDKMVKDVYRVLEQNGIRSADWCPICGKKNCDSFAHIERSYWPVHKMCVQRAYGRAESDLKKKIGYGRLPFALFGALIAGLIAFIPVLLGILNKVDLPGYICLLFPFVIFIGYSVAGGQLEKAMFIAITTLSVLFGTVINICVYIMGIHSGSLLIYCLQNYGAQAVLIIIFCLPLFKVLAPSGLNASTTLQTLAPNTECDK